MFSVTTWPGCMCCVLPFTVSLTPGGLPMTIATGCFSCQVMVCPAGMVTWDRDCPEGLSNPTQQSAVAVSVMTATFFGTAALCVTGVVVTFAFAASPGRTVAVGVAELCVPRVETT